MAAARGAELGPATVTGSRQSRAANRRQAQESAILKRAIASERLRRVISQTPDQGAVTASAQRDGTTPCGGPASWWRCRPAATTRGTKRRRRQPGRWSRRGQGKQRGPRRWGVHKRCGGTRRPRVGPRRKGHRVGRQRLRTAMRRRGLYALPPKAFAPRTTGSTHGLRRAPNRLLDQPRPTQANPGQPGLGRRHYVPAAGQRRPGLSVRLSRPGQQASGGGWQAGGWQAGGHHARRIGDPCLTTGLLVPAVHAGPARALGSGRAVLGQRLP